MSKPYLWHPTIIDTQVLKIGSLMIAAVPGEFTTMSGRRMRKAIQGAVTKIDDSQEPVHVMIAGLSNMYTHYISTFEEYQKQRYEAASTIYGPHTLRAYLQQFSFLTESMVKGENVSSLVEPPDLSEEQISLVPLVLFDYAGIGHKFGDVLREPETKYKAGDTVTVEFVAGHPRNDLLLEDSFLEVRRLEDGSSDKEKYSLVAVDGSWETKMTWSRTNYVTRESKITITWDIPQDAAPGSYYITHKGHYKSLISSVHPYSGSSEVFVIGSLSANRASRYTSSSGGQSYSSSAWKRIDQTLTRFIKEVTSTLSLTL
eukprot:TRINITY_DN26688_c0_g1_i1.p1 TRINITY_DN26688_c0_g1~~TRINITY_DN26688_c0_g1_i1.p1  ORF type:complete len:315 (+),score=64.03 TRINITY_DN26688_c0_g1_i1:298-1242(+)